MKPIWTPIAVVCLTVATLVACKKDAKVASQDNSISQQTLAQIKALGFSTTDIRKVDDGYLVEGDIVLNDELLNSQPEYKLLRVGDEEQYRTTNLVKSLPRTIKILVSNLGTAYVQGADLAISRYNALNLQIKFQRITSGTANITIVGFNQGPSGGYITLGSSGFPNKKGDPYNQIKMNTNQYAYGSNPDVTYVGSVIQHELGHCIGFRHTDYMNRAYSCGGTPVNEGASNIGGIHIPGTPTGPDANSW
ncbi:MAG TPA: M57 family metalloprotease, partial [Flavisolibacter sp.]|nr:M57 family metalloprotease [Flavisolibacter sp.]